MDLNKVMIIGRLTRDPEMRSLPSGKSVTVFCVATGRQWTDANGQKQKQTEFHNVVAWGRMAETASQYLHKASRIYVEGRLQTRDWVGQDGLKKYRTELVAENFIMLDSKFASNAGVAASTGGEPVYEEPALPQPAANEQIKVEDIPF